jgi:hypothetical protein
MNSISMCKSVQKIMAQCRVSLRFWQTEKILVWNETPIRNYYRSSNVAWTTKMSVTKTASTPLRMENYVRKFWLLVIGLVFVISFVISGCTSYTTTVTTPVTTTITDLVTTTFHFVPLETTIVPITMTTTITTPVTTTITTTITVTPSAP